MQTSVNILNHLLKDSKINLDELVVEEQNAAYEGFSVPELTLRSRLANLTPKKAGYFVAHYVKEAGQPNRPYTEQEGLDTLAICIPDKGAFFFTKETLVKHGILRASKPGKMGFRVYLPDESYLNSTAQKTQMWQSAHYKSLESK